MTQTGWEHTEDQTIPSDSMAGKQVIDQLLGKLAELEWNESDVFGVHLAVEEALVNAIKHGNQNDKNKNVHVHYKASPESIHIQITDEGAGFNPDDVPNPTEDENLELPSGRGLMLMRSFMSSVQFNGQGNQVTMEKSV